jgi:integrase
MSLFSLPEAAAAFPANPIKLIPAAKIKRQEVLIASAEETAALLAKAAQDDPEMLPWLAIAFFGGLRPESELGRLNWLDINFEEKWIRVDFGNKTDTKRFVDLADNLAMWLKPFAQKSGKIKQTNHRKRKDKIVGDTLKWERDISRHTYGSNLEAQARAEGKDAKAVVLANMGHTVTQTFEQHYRNARTAKQAAEFWAIIPPKS